MTHLDRFRPTVWLLLLPLVLGLAACGAGDETTHGSPEPEATASTAPADLPRGLLVSLAVLGKTPEGKPAPQPARLGILSREGGEWLYRTVDDPDSNVFHKAMVYDSDAGSGVLTFGGSQAKIELWRPGAEPEVIWQKDFGGKFSRMRDGEVADLDGDGTPDIAVATHDQGVVAVISPDGEGGWSVDEIDQEADTFVHEIEIGDLDGDGTLEVYATPSEPNKADGSAQPGKVVRFVPATGEGRVVVADLGDRHAKEILVHDVDGDGTDELYVSVEAVSGGQVEIRRYDAGTDPTAGEVIAAFDDTQCRFLTPGDVDGDGDKEIVAAAFRSGLWLLDPTEDGWAVSSIDRDSGGFEHAAILTDLDGDGADELYVASDKNREIRRYVWVDGQPQREVIHRFEDEFSRFTWNLMPAPLEVMP